MSAGAATRTRGSLELIAVLGSGLVFVWIGGPAVVADPSLRWPVLVAAALGFLYLVYVSPCLLHGDSMSVRGLGGRETLFVRTDNLRPALVRFGALAGIAAAALVIATAVTSPATLAAVRWDSVLLKLSLYVPSAVGQQLVLTGFLLVRLQQVVPGRGRPEGSGDRRSTTGGDDRCGGSSLHRIVVCALLGAIFGLFHLPNPTMILLAVPFGFAMAWVYYEVPNLVAAALSHALVGTVLHRIVQVDTRIGPFYGSSEIGLSRELLPFIDRIIGNVY